MLGKFRRSRAEFHAAIDALERLAAATAQQNEVLTRELDRIVAASAKLGEMLGQKLDEVIASSANQTDLINRKLGALVEGSSNQTDLLNRKLGEVADGDANLADLLNRKLEAVIEGDANLADLLNHKLADLIKCNAEQTNLLSQKLAEAIDGDASLVDLLKGKLQELIDGDANLADLLNRKLEELIGGDANLTNLLNQKLEAVIDGNANLADLLNRRSGELIERNAEQADLLRRKLDQLDQGLSQLQRNLETSNARLNQLDRGLEIGSEKLNHHTGVFISNFAHLAQGLDHLQRDLREPLASGVIWFDVSRKRSKEELLAAANTALEVEKRDGSRAATMELFRLVGLEHSSLTTESSDQAALHYHLALIYSIAGQAGRALWHIERSGALPATGAPQLYWDSSRESLQIQRRRELARVRGMPTFVISSMPRAASTSLTHTLATTFDLPLVRVSMGHPPDAFLVPQWFKAVHSGGSVLHDHFSASPHNLKIIKEYGIREIDVLVRDPRAAAYSLIRHIVQGGVIASPKTHREWESNILSVFRELYVPWLDYWLRFERDGGQQLKIHWIKSAELSANLPAVVRDILDRYVERYPALNQFCDKINVVTSNFVHGGDDAWREQVSKRAQHKMWELLPDGAATLLQLAP